MVQRVLVTLGATSFGLGAGALGGLHLVDLLVGGGRDSWGALPLYLFMAAVGAVAGAIAGFMASLALAHAKEHRPYNLWEWLGLAMGLAVAVVMSPHISRSDFPLYHGLCLAVFFPFLANIGRVLLPWLVSKLRSRNSNVP